MEAFQPFTLTHGLMLAATAAAAAFLSLVGLRQRANSPTRLERALALTNLAIGLLAHGWWILPPQLDPATTLPLQLCHLAAVVASLALLTRRRIFCLLLYFWGFGLSTQALLTPMLTEPPSSPWFWAFWAQHGFVLAAAVYIVAVLKFRPAWRDYWLACRITFLYGLMMLPLNLAIGANYGFVGNSRPETPSIIDFLGPWPERLAAIVLLVAGVMALLMLPWEFGKRRRARSTI